MQVKHLSGTQQHCIPVSASHQQHRPNVHIKQLSDRKHHCRLADLYLVQATMQEHFAHPVHEQLQNVQRQNEVSIAKT